MSFKQTLTNLFGHNAVKKALIWVLVGLLWCLS